MEVVVEGNFSPESIIRKAEAEKRIGIPLAQRILKETEGAREISSRLGLPRFAGGLEIQVENMGTFLNMAFIKKERVSQGREVLEVLYNRNPQEFLNLLLGESEMYYDSEGRLVSLEEYLRDYYHFLENFGFSLSIEFVSQLPKELSFIYEKKNFTQEREILSILEILERKNIPLPLLVIKVGERVRKIPIIAVGPQFLRGAFAKYEYTRRGKQISEEIIYCAVDHNRFSIIEMPSSLVHEIDHAVFNFFYFWGDELSQVKLLEEEEKGLAREDEEDLVNQFIYHFNEDVISEGLATVAQEAFMRWQGEGLAKFLKEEDIQKGLALILDYYRLSRQVGLELVVYIIGEVLIKFAGEDNFPRFYMPEFLNKLVINSSELIKKLLRYFVSQRNTVVGVLKPIIPLPEYSIEEMKRRLRTGLGKFRQPFILGREYFELLEVIEKEVDQLTPQQVDERLEEFRKLKPEIVAQSLLNMDKRRAVASLECVVGRVRQRFEEELDRLFSEIQ